jgi:hypothetical protein
MERCAGIIGQRGPVAVGADEEGYVNTNSFGTVTCAWRTSANLFREDRGLADNLEAKLQPVIDTSSPAVIEAVDVVMLHTSMLPQVN